MIIATKAAIAQAGLAEFSLTWDPAPAGTPFTTGSYTGVDFTSSATVTIVAGGKDIEYVVVGGGGSGGQGSPYGRTGGGGGAGGYRAGTLSSLPAGAFTVTVGAASNASVFGPVTAGAGGNGGATGAGTSGGSGGGGSSQPGTSPTVAGGSGNTPPTSPSQGNAGGLGNNHPDPSPIPTNRWGGAGGGGGATGAGTPGTSIGYNPTPFGTFPEPAGHGWSGPGGTGVDSVFKGPGSPVKLAGGGGGSGIDFAGAGGYGGGWNGSGGPGGGGQPDAQRNGQVNTGGGGGGGNNNPSANWPARPGGSGRVMIRWVP